MLDENRVHVGHRRRMKDKFEAYGQEIFGDYELIEMLLYNVIPQRDTNPVAKMLLDRFGSVDGVLSASVSELVKVSGIGEKAAEFIYRVGCFTALPQSCSFSEMPRTFESADKVGKFFAEYFKGTDGYSSALMLLDNSMRAISVERLGDCDLSSGALSSKVFLVRALRRGASAAVVAHTHPHGPLYPSGGDVTGYEMLMRELESVGVTFLESFIVTGERYMAMSKALGSADKFSAYVRLKSTLATSSGECREESMPKRGDSVDKIVLPLLKCIMNDEKAKSVASNIEKGLPGVRILFESDFGVMRSFCGIPDSAVHLIRLCAALASRRMTESLRVGDRYDEDRLDRFVKGIFLDKTRESVCIISFDADMIFKGAAIVGEGTVNQSGVVPRRLLERAVSDGAKYVYIAHNHPRGNSEPSDDDISATAKLIRVFAAVGIELKAHFVVAGVDCRAIGMTMGDAFCGKRGLKSGF